MKKADVIEYFGNAHAVARALGIERAAVYQWGVEIPQRRAFEIEKITNGELKANFAPPADVDSSINKTL